MTDYQLEYRGLTLGLGTNYHVNGVEGLEDDEVEMGDAPLPRRGGDIPGLHVANARQVILEVSVKGTKGSQALRDDIEALHLAFQHSEDEYALLWDEPGLATRRYVWARPSGRASKRTPRQPFLPQYKLRLKLADPRTYEEFSNTGLLTNYDAAGGGIDYDFDYPNDYVVDTSNQTTVNNAGNTKAWPILQFFGPTVGTVTQVTITNTTTGQASVFDTAILTGQTLTADMDAIVAVRPNDDFVIRLGAVNKYSDWAQPRDPLYLAPGDNVLRFEVTGGTSTDATASITYHDTWN